MWYGESEMEGRIRVGQCFQVKSSKSMAKPSQDRNFGGVPHVSHINRGPIVWREEAQERAP
jgi:hypothetical protein